MVTWLFVDGVTVTSFIVTARITWPRSLKIVGHGVWAVHGAGAVTFVITSDSSGEPNAAGADPFAPCSEFITSSTGARLSRTTSPHDTPAATSAASAKSREVRITVTFRSPFDDSRCDEHEQLGV